MASSFDEDVLLIDMPVATQAVALGIQVGQTHPVSSILWGPPGIGKTKSIYAVGNALNLHTEVVIASLHAPEDFSGMPVVIDGRMQYIPADFVRRLNEHGGGICFLDEASTAPPSVQAVMLRMIQEGVVGDAVLNNVSFVAAANPAHQAAGGWDLSAPLANRFCHLRVRLNVKYLTSGMIGGFNTNQHLPTLPKGWQREMKRSTDLIAAYLDSNPTKALQMPEDAASAGYAWASPRSWFEIAAPLQAGCWAAGADSEVLAALLFGSVGDKVALEYLEWANKLDLPRSEDLFSGKVKFVWEKTRTDKMFVILTNISSYVEDMFNLHANDYNLKDQIWSKAWEFMRIGVDNGGAETVAAAGRNLAIAGRKQKPQMKLPIREATALIPVLQASGLMLEG